MYFDGENREKKKISLRGTSKQAEDKEQFLQRTRQERSDRQREKQLRTAATRIVKFLRFAKLKHTLQRGEREYFDLETVKWKDGEVVKKDELIRMVRCFLFFYNDKDEADRTRFLKIGQVLAENISKSYTEDNYCASLLDTNSSIFIHQLKKLLLICMRILSLEAMNRGKAHPYTNVALALKLLIMGTHTAHWRFTKNKELIKNDEIRDTLVGTCNNILGYLVDQKLYSSLRSHFLSLFTNGNQVIPNKQDTAHYAPLVTLVCSSPFRIILIS